MADDTTDTSGVSSAPAPRSPSHPAPGSQAGDLRDEVQRWVRQLKPWMQELFIRSAAAPEVAEHDAQEIAAMLLGESAARPREIDPDDLPELEEGSQPLTIDRITGLTNVNAIEDGQTLAFKPAGVNVVWGANGAGKTGYSRVLKKAGRTLYPEEVLTNVYAEGGGGPRATLAVAVGGEGRVLELDLDADAPPPLGRICVADSRAGEIYLTEETEVDYVPTKLTGLTRLASGFDAVRSVLERRRDEIQSPQIDPRVFGEGTRVAAFVADIDGNTEEAGVRALAKLSAEEEERRTALRRRLGEMEAMQVPQLRKAAQREAEEVGRLRDDLRLLAGFLDTEAVDDAVKRQTSIGETQQAADLAAKQFEGEPLEEIGSEPWRVLWSAACGYAAHLGQALPPDHEPAHCPLCMQELDEDARKRLHSFQQFVADDVNTRLRRLQAEREDVLRRLPDVNVIRDRHEGAIAMLGSDEGQLGELVTQWLDLAAAGIERLRTAELDGLEPLPPPPDLASWIEGRNEEAKRQAGIERSEEKEKVRAELAELDGRHALGGRLEEVLAALAAHKEIDRLKKAISETSTSAVSHKIRSLSQALIQDGLEQALKHQMQALELHDIEVVPKMRTVRGQPMAGLAFRTVENVPLTAVLSHGEQRRLALAMFLAEMEVRADPSPVVFDDPTSSIDQEGRPASPALC